ncbi:class I SAM-dependent methyltransferase [Cupriavidus basilensis]|uniref:Class I SAM-dependent methyltransferase n=1 Tax=Cupriavidus basilensis TaxID=68895 RepID=A0ABT6AR64_9BURK|nr:class I SAM-dependent methyltransferase [Cupriavidus basilensis]MDF3835115.1 class I SAM-dependent methyltransferase [Cupriavidus basilensis]
MDKAEFDQFANEYLSLHAANIRASGEAPEFFASYKVADALRETRSRRLDAVNILDFGSGVGNAVPFFLERFPLAELTCADISRRSLEISRLRFPNADVTYAEITGNRLPFPDEQFDLVFSACVFHHVPEEEHVSWLAEMRRVTRHGGVLIVFEHNPLNFLTVSAVRNCPFDANARLVSARTLRHRTLAAGWRQSKVTFRIFFPHALAFARPLERWMGRVPFAAQYFVSAARI